MIQETEPRSKSPYPDTAGLSTATLDSLFLIDPGSSNFRPSLASFPLSFPLIPSPPHFKQHRLEILAKAAASVDHLTKGEFAVGFHRC